MDSRTRVREAVVVKMRLHFKIHWVKNIKVQKYLHQRDLSTTWLQGQYVNAKIKFDYVKFQNSIGITPQTPLTISKQIC